MTVINPPVPLAVGGGDNFNASGTNPVTAGQLIDLRVGTAAAPDTTVNPVIKVSRTIQLTSAQLSGDNAEQGAAIEGVDRGNPGGVTQVVGVYGAGSNVGNTLGTGTSPDAVGLFGRGVVAGAGVGIGMGGFFLGRSVGSGVGTGFSGIQVQASNGLGSDKTPNAAAFSGANGIFITSSGANKAACAIEIGNTAPGKQFDAGIYFNNQAAGGTNGGIVTTSFRDDCSALTSIQINGTHATAGIDMSAATIASAVGLKLAAQNIVTDTTTGTKIGTATTQKFGFFNAAPIIQPNTVGTATGYTAGATAATFHSDDTYTGNTGATAYTINGIVANLKNLGLLAA